MAIAAGEIVTAPALNRTLSGEAGSVNVSISAATFGTATVTFSTAFSAVPSVSVTIVSGSGSMIRATVFVSVISTTGMTIRIDANATVTGTFPVNWIAVG